MACSSAQIHGLGTPSFASSRTLFLGQRLNTKAFIKVKSKPRRHAPLRVVNEKVVGIDLGTTNSAVAAMEGGKPTIITNAEGQRTTPSVVAYTKTGDRLVGQIAKRQAVVNPENTFFSVKRFIGRKMSEVDEESKQVSYRVIRDDNGNVKLDCPAIGKQFAAEEISAQRIVDWLASNFKKDEGIDLLKDKQALQRLTETAEKAKMDLSSLSQTNISLPFITATADGPKHIETTLTRAKFEELSSDLLDRLRTPVENSLRDAKLSFKDLDEVILVGGSTRIPAVQELVKKLTGKDPNVTVNPDEVVALGAAVQVERMVKEAEKFSKEDKEKRDAIDTKNQADSVVYQTEKQLKELGDKVPGPVKEKVEAKLGELKDAISGGSTQAIKDAMAALNQEVMQLGQSLYNQPGAAGAGGPTPPPGADAGPSESSGKGPDGDVIDADFTDSK
ncbi:hypothetical protein V8G54_033409 [Vigna mungo]|uniref:Stromal 70 kDa heat shock-related protein, chloroplastic n=1 Tax=Vigna mungo TaxID=3915 RepID=A0AAQ3MN88_VIGMU